MKNYIKTTKIASYLFMMVLVISCTNNNNGGDLPALPEPDTISELIFLNGRLSLLTEALDRTGLLRVLDEDGEYTLLAPPNEAFERFLIANNYRSVSDVPVIILRRILLNHVIDGRFNVVDLVEQPLSTLATQDNTDRNLSMIVDDSTGDFIVNGESSIDINNINVQVSNGVVHIINDVISLPTIMSFIEAIPNLSALSGDLPTELENTFMEDSGFTVLAPTNAAFLNASNLPSSQEALINLLLNHVLDGNIISTDFQELSTNYSKTRAVGPTMDNLSLHHLINNTNQLVFNGNAVAETADIIATNGTLHVVNNVISLPTVAALIDVNPDFSTLIEALTTLTPATPFVDILSRLVVGNQDMIDPPFTVFAPTNEAFAAIMIPEEDELTQILLHHVNSGLNATANSLNTSATTSIETLEGDDLNITTPGTDPNIADISDGSGNTDLGLIEVDIQGTNGVIHILNKVAIPNIE